MNHFTNRQVIVLCVLSVGFGALFSPPLKSVAQPPESSTNGNATQVSETPQPLATPPADATTRTTRAIGTITGQGTAGNIPKFTGPNAIGNSVMFENAGKIGIGTTTPGGLLSVKGTAANVYPIYGLGVGNTILGSSSGGIGVYGQHTNATGTQAGVAGDSKSTAANAAGVLGTMLSTASGSDSAGVRGINNSTSGSGYGVYGSHTGGVGVYGSSSTGYGVHGTAASGYGVYGSSSSSYGIYGFSANNNGVYGTSSKSNGVYGNSARSNGVYGNSYSANGVYGNSYSANGVYGTSSYSRGVSGQSLNDRGVYGNGYVGVEGEAKDSSSYAGNFKGRVYIDGNLTVTGTLYKGAGSFKIDHPQHPATEYLSHSFVESPDMMNVYNGNATTNAKGEAWVEMPSYFQALNRDFRYQLTPIGQFAQVIVGQKIRGNRFLIRTDKPNVEVSWQITGIRNDAYARQHRIKVEESKATADRGRYLYPAGFGFGKDRQIGAQPPRLAQR